MSKHIVLEMNFVTKRDDNLVWLDLEMTGLDVNTDCIIEIATVVTDAELNVLAEGPVLAVKQSDAMLDGMDEWCTNTHTASGLVQRVRESHVTEFNAEAQTLEFLAEYVKPGKSPLCGNSIWQDRRFLAKYMPKLEAFFHYRLVDVSTFKELARRWSPKVYNGFQKESKHLALDDIYESIDELRYYREHIWHPSQNSVK